MPAISTSIDGLRVTADAFNSNGWTLAAEVWAWTYDTGGGRPSNEA
jgi:hypothetical protein